MTTLAVTALRSTCRDSSATPSNREEVVNATGESTPVSGATAPELALGFLQGADSVAASAPCAVAPHIDNTKARQVG